MLTALGDLRVRHSVRRASSPTSGALERKPALVVTGGSQGLGPDLVRSFADTADVVIVVARGAERLERVAATLSKDLGKPVWPLALDLTDDAAGAAIAGFAEQNGAYVHVLINNAGSGYAGFALEQDKEALANMLALNMRVPAQLVQQFLPEMLERGMGGIVNISSLGGAMPGPYQAHYYASKAYVTSFTEAVAHEVSGRGVRVIAVAPGPVDTPFHATMGGENAIYRYVLPSSTTRSVARAARRGYALGQRVVVPGIFNRVMAIASAIIPHVILVPFVGLLLRPPHTRK